MSNKTPWGKNSLSLFFLAVYLQFLSVCCRTVASSWQMSQTRGATHWKAAFCAVHATYIASTPWAAHLPTYRWGCTYRGIIKHSLKVLQIYTATNKQFSWLCSLIICFRMLVPLMLSRWRRDRWLAWPLQTGNSTWDGFLSEFVLFERQTTR